MRYVTHVKKSKPKQIPFPFRRASDQIGTYSADVPMEAGCIGNLQDLESLHSGLLTALARESSVQPAK